MQAFLCVYRHSVPSTVEWAKTKTASLTDPLLAKFLAVYHNPNCFFDWGDDPSFFAATEVLCNPLAASWGVCRRDVRANLRKGDLVVWFCAKEDNQRRGQWLYFFIGCATVSEVLSRQQLWQDPKFSSYTKFYNTLVKPVDGSLVQHETFHKYHVDWQKRASAGYVIFDDMPQATALNLTDPLPVAEKGAESPVEKWLSSENPRVKQLETAIFTNLGITRRLIPFYSHRIALQAAMKNG